MSIVVTGRVAEVLRAHQLSGFDSESWSCTCGIETRRSEGHYSDHIVPLIEAATYEIADRLRRLCASPFDVLEIEYEDGVFTDTPVVRVADVIAALPREVING